ncbi:5-(carboxyamino)imidazole ribonucleotide synthase [Alkalicella caledoniensis]|uniref:N5-carboxyaminoimidazole ribonucleotide synthase n=1 Tax=Alkalicella caledoniensis TaxID=2731377 RepID=A0A7G9W705_ALKCA|nr:5-(carboxyamino)imidazole ribonucleotide synthase [Alkalicella caledoniensis]QNO14467.1 5-(carboxyamino)imidazole ribonucleotide synthase [Alkalicella caledoniensis]
MSRIIPPGSTIGILGGGQLGRMMALSARYMGYNIAVMEPSKNSPCGQIADHEVIATYNDIEGARELAKLSDVLTYEFENISAETAKWIEENANLPQGSDLLLTTQHRGTEKKAIENLGTKVAPYMLIDTVHDLLKGVKNIGIPSVLKTCRGGYDGKGQYLIKSPEDIEIAYESLKGKGQLVLEQWIPFELEVSVIVTRNQVGEVTTFPVGENIHINQILHATIVPARVDEEVIIEAQKIAIELARGLNLVGTLAVEMFVTETGEIYVNELAPRPHNSGHYTIEACETDQFEQHIRAICNLPLGSTQLLKPSIMVNILGEHMHKVLENLDKLSDYHLHLYGKKEAKTGRKMGHLTVIGESIEECMSKANELGIWPELK